MQWWESLKRYTWTDRKPALNVSFSGSGFLLFYHLGVAKALQEEGWIQPHSKFAGASGGALVATVLAAGIPLDHAFQVGKSVVSDCREQGTGWQLERILTEVLTKTLSNVQIHRVQDRLSIATTRLWPNPKMVLKNTFDSKEDLMHTILTSCYIPCYSASSPMRSFQGEFHIVCFEFFEII